MEPSASQFRTRGEPFVHQPHIEYLIKGSTVVPVAKMLRDTTSARPLPLVYYYLFWLYEPVSWAVGHRNQTADG